MAGEWINWFLCTMKCYLAVNMNESESCFLKYKSDHVLLCSNLLMSFPLCSSKRQCLQGPANSAQSSPHYLSVLIIFALAQAEQVLIPFLFLLPRELVPV